MRKAFKRAFPMSLPVMAGYIFLGIAYGVAMRARGMSMWMSLSMSTVVYGGSLQFALIEPLTQAFAPLTLVILTCLIQARHIFYGLSMLTPYRAAGKYKPYLIFSLTDETYSIVCSGAPDDVNAAQWFTCVSFLDQVYWVTGTLLGAIAGELIPLSYLEGIDFSMTALFVVIVTDQTMKALESYKKKETDLSDVLFAPLLGGLGTLISLLLVGKDSFLLLSMAIIMGGFVIRYTSMNPRKRRQGV